MEKRHGLILSNILLRNLAKVKILRLGKEPLKMLKLSYVRMRTDTVSRWYFCE